VEAQQVRQAHDADQRMRRFQARNRLVVVQHAVGQEGIEVPAFDQPGARLRCVICSVRCSTAHSVLVVARHEVERVFLGRGRQQRQAADVVQQAGQVGFLDVRVLHLLGHVARDHGGGERTFPEAAQVGAARMGEAVEGLEHRFADDQRLDHVGAERHQRLLEADRALVAVVGRAVGDGEYLAGHRRILGDEGGQLRHASVVGLQVLNQLNEYLRHCRQTGNQQAIANIMVRLMHRIKRSWGPGNVVLKNYTNIKSRSNLIASKISF
jgi:hypothetical protein